MDELQRGERRTHWFGLRAGDKQFLVERCEIDGVEYLVIDGVRCSPEVIRALLVEPRADRWLRFERQGDVVIVHQVHPGEAICYEAPKAHA